MRQTPPERIVAFIRKRRVAGLALLHPDGSLWASNCFYVYDPAEVSLVMLSSRLSSGKPRHVEALRRHAAVDQTIAGTIAGTSADLNTGPGVGPISELARSISAIQGVQFVAKAYEPQGEARNAALERYYTKFPFARAFSAEVWTLRLEMLKFTDNTFVFAHKTLWSRPRRVD